MTSQQRFVGTRPAVSCRGAVAIMTAGLFLIGCSSPASSPPTTTTTPGSTSPATGAPTVSTTSAVTTSAVTTRSSSTSPDGAANAGTETPVTLAGELRAKEAVTALEAIFAAAGIETTGTQLQSTLQRVPECPLGSPRELTAQPPAPVAGLDKKATYTLERTRDPEPAIRCAFSNDLPADAANSIPANRTSSFLEYQVTYIPAAQLRAYVKFLENQGFDPIPNSTFGGAIYSHCDDATPPPRSPDYRNCAAIWMNGVIAVALRFAGPDGKSIDVSSWLTKMIEPILNALADSLPTSAASSTSRP
jgi:hypothetical protein